MRWCPKSIEADWSVARYSLGELPLTTITSKIFYGWEAQSLASACGAPVIWPNLIWSNPWFRSNKHYPTWASTYLLWPVNTANTILKNVFRPKNKRWNCLRCDSCIDAIIDILSYVDQNYHHCCRHMSSTKQSISSSSIGRVPWRGAHAIKCLLSFPFSLRTSDDQRWVLFQ